MVWKCLPFSEAIHRQQHVVGSKRLEKLFFYQISDRIRPAIGQLTVNGGGNYRAIALAAGKALPTQDRMIRDSKSYLEGINADNSRNGDAQSPSPRLAVEAVSPTFNDHLAY